MSELFFDSEKHENWLGRRRLAGVTEVMGVAGITFGVGYTSEHDLWVGKAAHKVIELQSRTVAVILIWIVVAMLFINKSLRSEWLWFISIALLVIAVVAYFLPRLRRAPMKA